MKEEIVRAWEEEVFKKGTTGTERERKQLNMTFLTKRRERKGD